MVFTAVFTEAPVHGLNFTLTSAMSADRSDRSLESPIPYMLLILLLFHAELPTQSFFTGQLKKQQINLEWCKGAVALQ